MVDGQTQGNTLHYELNGHPTGPAIASICLACNDHLLGTGVCVWKVHCGSLHRRHEGHLQGGVRPV